MDRSDVAGINFKRWGHQWNSCCSSESRRVHAASLRTPGLDGFLGQGLKSGFGCIHGCQDFQALALHDHALFALAPSALRRNGDAELPEEEVQLQDGGSIAGEGDRSIG